MTGTALVVMVTTVVFIGSVMQRVGGMGFGLIAAPVLSFVIDPIQGILLVNLLASINAIMNAVSVRSGIDWRMVRMIGSVMVIGSLAGALLIHSVSVATLQVIVGLSITVALLIVIYGRRFVPPITGRAPVFITGAIAGFTNTLAGVAGPVLTVYGQAAKWDHARFSATLQPLFVISGALSFIVKEFTGAASMGSIPWALWPTSIIAMVAATTVGARVAKKINRDAARNFSIFLAFAGAISVLIRGVYALV